MDTTTLLIQSTLDPVTGDPLEDHVLANWYAADSRQVLKEIGRLKEQLALLHLASKPITRILECFGDNASCAEAFIFAENSNRSDPVRVSVADIKRLAAALSNAQGEECEQA